MRLPSLRLPSRRRDGIIHPASADGERAEKMRKMKLLVAAVLAASTVAVSAPPAQAQTARCLPEYYVVCLVITTVCRLSGRPCYA